MSIPLSSENEGFLRDLVQAGAFASEAAALDAAVGLLKRKQALRTEIQAGIDEADVESSFREKKFLLNWIAMRRRLSVGFVRNEVVFHSASE